jgi:hypothetical protein
MPRIVITHPVVDIERWSNGNDERAAALSPSPGTAARAESQGVFPPMTACIER